MFDPRTRKRQRRRRQKIKQKQTDLQFNWFLGFITLLLWVGVGFIFIFVEPELLKNIPFAGWYGPFFLLLFAALLALSRLLTGNRKRSILLAVLSTSFLILRINQVGQWYNGLILVALGIVIEYFWISQFKFKWRKNLTTPDEKLD